MDALVNAYQNANEDGSNANYELNLNRALINRANLVQYPSLFIHPQVPLKNKVSLTFNFTSTQEADGLIWLNEITASAAVPIIRYVFPREELLFISEKKSKLLKIERDSTQVYTKVWTGLQETRQLLSLFSSDVANSNIINFVLWVGENSPSGHADNRNYVVGKIDISQNQITLPSINTWKQNEGETITRIKSRLQQFVPLDVEVQFDKINAYDIDFSFLGQRGDMPMIEPLTFYYFAFDKRYRQQNSFLYLAERGRPSGARKTIRINAKIDKWNSKDQLMESIDQGTIILTPSFLPRDVNLNENNLIYSKGWPIINVSIKGLINNSEYERDLIISLGRTIYSYAYNNIKASISEVYKGMLLDIWTKYEQQFNQKWQKDQQLVQYGGEKAHEQIKQYLPNLGPKYTRLCATSIPSVIDVKDVDFSNKFPQTSDGHRVLPYPADAPILYLACDQDPDYPYPTVRRKDKSDMKKFEYPYYPCCIKTDPEDPSSPQQADYQHFYHGQKSKEMEIKAETFILHSRQKFQEDRIHDVPKILEHIFNIEQHPENNKLGYIATVPNNNIFLHGIVLALETPSYLQIINDMRLNSNNSNGGTTEFVERLRSNLGCFIHPSAGAQENWAHTDEDLRAELIDNSVFLDPSRFVHILEEIFNVNIFIFQKDPDQTYNLQLELPRYQYWPIRRYGERERKRATLVFLNLKAERRGIPLYAPLAYVNTYNLDRRAYFRPDEAKVLFDIYESTLGLRDVYFVNQQLIVRRDWYQYLDWPIKDKPDGQIIDGSGKCRGLVYSNITIFTPPSQPYNLPRATKPYPITTDAYAMQKLNATPTARTEEGIWFGVFFVLTQQPNPDLPLGAPNPLSEHVSGKADRLRKLKRIVNLITQLIRWLFLLSKMNRIQFQNNYIIIGSDTTSDSLQLYDLQTINPILPKVNTITDAMHILEQQIPQIIRQGKFYLYNLQFARKIDFYLQQVEQQRDAANNLPLPTKLIKWFTHPDDFTERPYNAVFMNNNQLQLWTDQIEELNSSIKLTTQLEWKLLDRIYPFFYEDKRSNQLMLIINVLDGDLGRALTAAQQWHLTGTNTGFNTPIQEINQSYEILTINPDKTLSRVNNTSPGVLTVLRYWDDKYAAIVPITRGNAN